MNHIHPLNLETQAGDTYRNANLNQITKPCDKGYIQSGRDRVWPPSNIEVKPNRQHMLLHDFLRKGGGRKNIQIVSKISKSIYMLPLCSDKEVKTPYRNWISDLCIGFGNQNIRMKCIKKIAY